MAEKVHYERILRAIGQSLENIEVESFDVETADDQYLVAGESKKKNAAPLPDPVNTKSIFGFIRNIGMKNTAPATRSQTYRFSGLRFTAADIDLLDQKGKVLRAQNNDSTPNPNSLSQVLRTVGAYLDHKASRPLKLSWHQQSLSLWHVNVLGVEAKEVFTPPDLYNLWVHQFKKRLQPTGSA